jgi:hypothetical protein
MPEMCRTNLAEIAFAKQCEGQQEVFMRFRAVILSALAVLTLSALGMSPANATVPAGIAASASMQKSVEPVSYYEPEYYCHRPHHRHHYSRHHYGYHHYPREYGYERGYSYHYYEYERPYYHTRHHYRPYRRHHYCCQ